MCFHCRFFFFFFFAVLWMSCLFSAVSSIIVRKISPHIWVYSGPTSQVKSSKGKNLLRNNLVTWGLFLTCLERLCTLLWHLVGIVCVFDSESTLKEQFDKEKATLQQSIHKNSALISEKDQQVENLRSEVRLKCMMVLSIFSWYGILLTWACTNWIMAS